jgi:hypothetical protein
MPAIKKTRLRQDKAKPGSSGPVRAAAAAGRVLPLIGWLISFVEVQ